MKHILLTFILAAVPWMARAHDHLEIGLAPADPTKLAVSGNLEQLATYFPAGEKPSNYLSSFPGGTFASELTFSIEGEVLSVPSPSYVQVEVVSVSGPVGGQFSFWEAGASTPTWTKEEGWTATPSDLPSFPVSEDGTGYGHIHGRVFTMDKAGVYDVTFRAVDTTGNSSPSATFTVRFTAISPPPLGISLENNEIKLTFASRGNLIYDVQSSTTLQANDWATIGTLDGTGAPVEFSDPLGGRPRVFYRLVEYQ